MKILISGAGIAGLTLAYWLDRYGHEVEIIEKSPSVQSQRGYLIIFAGAGLVVAEKMGIHPELKNRDNIVQDMRFHNSKGKQVASIALADFRKMYNNKVHLLLRGDIIRALYSKIEDKQFIKFETEIQAIDNNKDFVRVRYESGIEKQYDLLIGADGAYSTVRELVFGKEFLFTHDLGYQFSLSIQPADNKDKSNFYLYSQPKKQTAFYPILSDKEIVFNISKGNLDKIPTGEESFQDKLMQIQMPTWFNGRVVLVGDACQCLSLMSGQGASMAMSGAYVLATQLHQHQDDYSAAFQAYQDWMKPHIDRTQQSAQKFIRTFVPNSNIGIYCRNTFSKMLHLPFVQQLIFKGLHRNKIQLPF